jgi:hypothetical protein
MNDALTLANHAAQQNDRWLFIASLIVLSAVVVAVARYFVAERQEAAMDHKALVAEYKAAQEHYSKTLADIINNGNKTSQELAVCLDRNTRAFEEVSTVVRFCRENSQKGK